MSVDVAAADGALSAGAPVPLFEVPEFPPDFVRSTYDVAPGGERFLLLNPMEDGGPAIHVRTGWRPGGTR